MRNQTWNQKGQIVEDIEIYRDGTQVKVKNWLTGTVRDAILEEATTQSAEEKERLIQEAKTRFLTTLSKQTSPPWSDLLKDLAIVLGLTE